MLKFKTADRPVRGAVLRELKEVKEEDEAAAAGASISAQVEDSLECHCCRRSLAQEIMEDEVYICSLCELPRHECCVRFRKGLLLLCFLLRRPRGLGPCPRIASSRSTPPLLLRKVAAPPLEQTCLSNHYSKPVLYINIYQRFIAGDSSM